MLMWRSIIALAFACVLAPSLAHAQSAADVQNARQLVREALELSKQKKWEEAIALYERSLALKEAPITLYSVGVAYKQVGRRADALESLRQFLAKPSTPSTKDFEDPAREAIAELEPLVAHVTITVEPADAENLHIKVDEREMPLAGIGLPRLVDAGAHRVTANARGYRDASVEIDIGAGDSKDVTLTLEPEPVAEAAGPVVDPAATGDDGDSGSDFPIVPVTLMAVGGTALGVGITLGLLGVSDADAAPTRDGPEAESARTKMLAGDIVAGVGGAIGAAGLVWLIVELASDDESEARFAPTHDGVRIAF